MILLMPILERVSWLAPWNSAGYSIAPTPTIVPWPCISRGTEWLVPSVPGVGERDRGALEVLGGEVAATGLADHVLVGRPELGEAQRLAALDRDDDQRALALGLAGQVDGQAEVDVLGLHDRRLAVHLGEVPVHHGELGQRLHDRVADHVREADLAAPGAAQLVVDDHPVVGEQLRRDGPHARGRGHGERGVHVLDHERRRAAQGGGHAVGLLAGALGRTGGRLRRAARRGLGAGAVARGGRGLLRLLLGGLRLAVGGLPAGLRDRGERGRGGRGVGGGLRGGARRRGRVTGAVVGEELVPSRVDAVRAFEETLVHLLAEPFVRAELVGGTAGTAAGHPETALIGSRRLRRVLAVQVSPLA